MAITMSVSFGLVSVPVLVSPATEEHRVRMHEVHRSDQGRIRHHRVCELDGQGDSVTMSSPHGFRVTGHASRAATAALDAKGEMDRRARSLASAREDLSQPPTSYNTQEQKQQQVVRMQAALEEVEQQFRAACVAFENEVAEWGSHAEISTALTEAAQAESERRERHRASHAAIAALPQLFIAV